MADTPPASPPAPPLWTTRLQRFGQAAVGLALLGVIALWVHELFEDPTIRQPGKLKVLLVLMPVAVLGTAALLLAWLGGWQHRRKR